MNYCELIDAIADNPLVFYTLMGLAIIILVVFCFCIKGPTYGYL